MVVLSHGFLGSILARDNQYLELQGGLYFMGQEFQAKDKHKKIGLELMKRLQRRQKQTKPL